MSLYEDDEDPRPVRISSVDIPFGDWVGMWIKASLAAIPAALCLVMIALLMVWALSACGIIFSGL